MKTKLLAALTIMGLIIISGCARANIPYDIDQILRQQKIVYIMSVSSYDEPYTEGYFIDGNGKKHIYAKEQEFDLPFTCKLAYTASFKGKKSRARILGEGYLPKESFRIIVGAINKIFIKYL